MRVRVLAFARLRELVGFGEREVALADGATLETLWDALARDAAGLSAHRASTRFARNGALADGATALRDGDEIALLPPVGGVWERLAADAPQLAPLRASTRFARNGELVDATAAVRDGDEIALLPPVGGG